jgi:protein arginine kinase
VKSGFNQVPRRLSRWQTTSGSAVTLTTRVEVYRNLANRLFSPRMTVTEREQVIQDVFWACDDLFREVFKGLKLVFLNEVGPAELHFLQEKWLASRMGAHPGEAVIFDEAEEISIEVNRQDHLIVRVIQGGRETDGAVNLALLIENALGRLLNYAKSRRFGFTTTQLEQAGTGLRVYVTGCYPSLASSDAMTDLGQRGKSDRVVVRKAENYGPAHIYHIFNRSTLGLSEEEIVVSVSTSAEEAERLEMAARENQHRKEGLKFDDRVWRAFGFLKYARLMPLRDLQYNFAQLRMGYGTLPDLEKALPVRSSGKIFFGSDPAILSYIRGLVAMEGDEDKEARAAWAREVIASAERAADDRAEAVLTPLERDSSNVG